MRRNSEFRREVERILDEVRDRENQDRAAAARRKRAAEAEEYFPDPYRLNAGRRRGP